jgi:putative PEP-CTERM system TPR-repeat lipoprotein
MRLHFPSLVPALLLASVVALSGCESSEERAERFYQSGLQLLEAGDVDRALVEFRNVFQLNGQHKEARRTYAEVQRERGKTGEAFGQYLRLVEQYPDDLPARIALAEMAIDSGNWEEAEKQGRAARDLAPQDPAVLVINAALDYRKALMDKQPEAEAAAIAVARAALEADPGNLIARRMVIDQKVTKGDFRGALPDIETGLAAHPGEMSLHMMRVRALSELGDIPATQAALEAMSAQFPQDEQVRQMMISWYVQQGDLPAAEAYLRQLAASETENPEAAKMTVVEFLRRTKGDAAAQAELDQLIAAEPGNATYRALRASLVFSSGKTAEAITEMEEMLKTAEPSDETRNLKVALAQMLQATDNAVGARGRIEEVLAEDPNHVEALKMEATWLIAEDKPGEAIIALRNALAQAPRDTSVITLMGQAHERDGSRDLAGERYALAVEVSERAPAPSLRYASFLSADGKIDTAEVVLEDAIRTTPGNVELLAALADIQLRKQSWDRVAAIISDLRAIGGESATGIANGVEAELLLRQERADDTVAFLEGLIADGDAGTAAKARMVQVQVQDGKLDEATAFLDAELAKTPDEPVLRFLRAGLYVLGNQPDEAETIYRALLQSAPSDQSLQALYGLLVSQGRMDDADALIEQVLATNPKALVPLLLKAGRLEKAQDFEGAIAIYETIYAENSSNLIVANNLASLITTHRSDPESLDRAAAIARRLRGSDVPAFQDTYGWIEYRRGNYAEAVKYLEPAAEGMATDALTQYHLGMTYVALQRISEARETLARALELAGDSPLPQFEDARKKLTEIGGE